MDTFRQVMLNAWGGPDQLSLQSDVPVPEPGPTEVRIRVEAATVSFTDTMIRRGLYPWTQQQPPFVPGYDFVGRIDKVGDQVTEWREGDRVMDLTTTGSYAEVVIRPGESLTRVPDDLDAADAVAMVLTWMTAYQMFTRFISYEPGDAILIHGAAGAVGQALAQLGKMENVKLIGTCSPRDFDRVIGLGVDPIDYHTKDLGAAVRLKAPQGIAAAFDFVGPSTFKESFKLLRKGGVLIIYGSYQATQQNIRNAIPKMIFKMLFNFLFPRGRAIKPYNIAGMKTKNMNWWRDDYAALVDLYKRGHIKPAIHSKIDLKDVPDAHRLLDEQGVRDKIVITMPQG